MQIFKLGVNRKDNFEKLGYFLANWLQVNQIGRVGNTDNKNELTDLLITR